jgi:hypothetical protein
MKLLPPLCDAPDWETFVVPGPGSERGLNRLYGRPLAARWPLPLFQRCVEEFRAWLNSHLEQHGIEPVDAQDAQKVLCESDKLFRAIEKGRRPVAEVQAERLAGGWVLKTPVCTEKKTRTGAETVPFFMRTVKAGIPTYLFCPALPALSRNPDFIYISIYPP